MEEEKAAAYYEELTRKGEGAARFKQGLGFSSSTSTQSFDTISKGSALPSSSSFLSSFVRASSPNKSNEIDNKKLQLENIQNKLKKKEKRSSDERENFSRVSDRRDDRDRPSRRRSRSRDRDRGRSERRRRRSRSRSYSRERHGRRRRSRSRSRSSSPRDRRMLDKSRDDDGKNKKEKNGGGVDYSRLIKGYAEM
ncbi:serine/arginine-rich splicing factor, partial [Thalictrum thalictroides]